MSVVVLSLVALCFLYCSCTRYSQRNSDINDSCFLETNFFTLAYILYDQAYKFIYICQLRTLCTILFYVRPFVLWILGLIWIRNTHWFVSIDGTPAPETKRRRIRHFRRLDVAVSYIQEMGVLLIEWSWIAVLKRKGKCIIACEVSVQLSK